MTAVGDWLLAVDFGTSYTAAAVRRLGGAGVRSLRLGSGSDVMPSGVLVESGDLTVGDAARVRAAAVPDSYVRAPKRWFGHEDELLLAGGVVVDDRDLVAAVLRHVLEAATREHAGTEPALVRVTHPVEWAADRQNRLRDAALLAGYGASLELLAEPIAAATQLLDLRDVPVGAFVGVYDFGGGTFDACVLQRTGTGFDVHSRRGHETLGGNHLDDRLIAHLRAVCDDRGTPVPEPDVDDPEYDDVADAFWRLREDVRLAKETLTPGRSHLFRLRAPLPRQDVAVSGALLDDLVEDDVAATLQLFEATVADAGLTVPELHTVYAIGGSSRLRLVGEGLRALLPPGVLQTVGDPKTVVAVGAAGIPVRAEGAAADGSPEHADLADAAGPPKPPAGQPTTDPTEGPVVAADAAPDPGPSVPAGAPPEPEPEPADDAPPPAGTSRPRRELAVTTGAQPAFADRWVYLGGVRVGQPQAAALDALTGEVRWTAELPEPPVRMRARGRWVVAQGPTWVTLFDRDGGCSGRWQFPFVQQVLLGDGVLWVRSAEAPRRIGYGGRSPFVVSTTVSRIDLGSGAALHSPAGVDVVQGALHLPTGVFVTTRADGRAVLSVAASAEPRILGGATFGMIRVEGSTASPRLFPQPSALGSRPWQTAVVTDGPTTVQVTLSDVAVLRDGRLVHRLPLRQGLSATAVASRHGALVLLSEGTTLQLLEPAPDGALRVIGGLPGSPIGEFRHVWRDTPATGVVPFVVEGRGGCWLPVRAPDGLSTTLLQVKGSPKRTPRDLGRSTSVPGVALPLGCPANDVLVYLDVSNDVVRSVRLDAVPAARPAS